MIALILPSVLINRPKPLVDQRSSQDQRDHREACGNRVSAPVPPLSALASRTGQPRPLAGPGRLAVFERPQSMLILIVADLTTGVALGKDLLGTTSLTLSHRSLS
jgi:hypothetical protein